MKLTLRLISIICYFFPFTFFLATCNGLVNIGIAYNQTEANRNILLEKESIKLVTDSTHLDQQILAETTKADTVNQNNLTDSLIKTSNIFARPSSDYFDMIMKKILFPTDTSLSGIGSILYFKNLVGQIAIALTQITH